MNMRKKIRTEKHAHIYLSLKEEFCFFLGDRTNEKQGFVLYYSKSDDDHYKHRYVCVKKSEVQDKEDEERKKKLFNGHET
jgi:hypothetical protein